MSEEAKNKDLGLQEVQKGVVKTTQPIIQLFEIALKARKVKSMIDSSTFLPMLADAVTFLGHASFLTSLKRRELLKPEIAKPYQSVVTSLMLLRPFCLVTNCNKHIQEIGEVNKISKRVSGRPNAIKNTVNTYKSGANGRTYQQRSSGRRTTFSGYVLCLSLRLVAY